MPKNFHYQLHRRATPFRKKEQYWVTIISNNGEPLFTSEKYVAREDAIHALGLVVDDVPKNLKVTGE